MPRSRDHSSEPPAGGTAMPVHSDLLLHELRSGERESFVRYYELYRAPVYNLVRWLLRGDAEAVPATQEVFATAYGRILQRDDCDALRAVTYTAALDVCRERVGEEADRGSAPSDAEADRRKRGDLGRRFTQGLEMLPLRYQAALRLHDLNGLRAAELAMVFAMTEDAAGALLFRAREAFRRAFEELSSDRRGTTCRLAEQTAAGAVGRSLSDEDLRRLHEHAGYCRHCRRTVKGWGGAAIGLALFLEDAPLPEELGTTPVFGTVSPIADAAGAVEDSGGLTRVVARIGRAMTSRAAAYALAAACLAVSVGLAVQLSHGDQVLFVPSPAAWQVPHSVPSAASNARPHMSVGGRAVAPSARSLHTAESHSVTSEPTVTPVADAGGPELKVASATTTADPSAASQQTSGRPGAAAPGAETPQSDMKHAVKAMNDAQAKHAEKGADTKHAAKAKGHAHDAERHAAKGAAQRTKAAARERATTHSHKAARQAVHGRTGHAKKAAKERAATHEAHKKSKKSKKNEKNP